MQKIKFSAGILLAFCCLGVIAAPVAEEEMFQQFEKIKNKKVLLCQAWTDRTPDVIVKNS